VAFILSAYRREVIEITKAIRPNTVAVSAELDRVDGKLSRHVGQHECVARVFVLYPSTARFRRFMDVLFGVVFIFLVFNHILLFHEIKIGVVYIL
jgi:hypothetical protein